MYENNAQNIFTVCLRVIPSPGCDSIFPVCDREREREREKWRGRVKGGEKKGSKK